MSTSKGKPTPAELLAKAQELAQYGFHRPTGPLTQLKGKSGPAVPDGVFDPSDLLSLPARSQPYSMPNGKVVWVHPVSPEEAIWLNVQALKEVRGMNLTDPQEAALQSRLRAQSYQAVCACRVGPESTARAVFHPDHAEALRRNLPSETLQQLCALSDRLGASSDAEYQQVLDFFGNAQTWLTTWLSQWTTDLPERGRSSLEAFAACVGRIVQRRTWDEQDVAAMQGLLTDLTAAPSSTETE